MKVKGIKKSERVRLIWRKRLEDWRSSGLSQAEYCRRSGIRPKSFAYWKKKEGESHSEVRFIPVSIPQRESAKKESCVKVILKGGYEIEVHDGFTPATLRAVVRTLTEAA